MSDRSWFVVLGDQQQGPYPEVQLRELIAEGRVMADTPVWSDGMADWQKAGEIAGLLPIASKPRKRWRYSRAALWGAFFGIGLIGLGAVSDGGADLKLWFNARPSQSIPYFVARIGVISLIFMAFAGIANLFSGRKSRPAD
jgi:hypothetical protein